MDVVAAYLAIARVEELAGSLRSRAQLAASVSQSLRWRSPAGAAFRQRAQQVCLDLVGVSATLDAIALDLRTAVAMHR